MDSVLKVRPVANGPRPGWRKLVLCSVVAFLPAASLVHLRLQAKILSDLKRSYRQRATVILTFYTDVIQRFDRRAFHERGLSARSCRRGLRPDDERQSSIPGGGNDGLESRIERGFVRMGRIDADFLLYP